MQHALDDLCNELLEILARHLINLEADEVRMKAIDYTHLFWACGVMRIDPCNGLMLAKLAHGVTAVAHQFSVQVGQVCRHYASYGVSRRPRSYRSFWGTHDAHAHTCETGSLD